MSVNDKRKKRLLSKGTTVVSMSLITDTLSVRKLQRVWFIRKGSTGVPKSLTKKNFSTEERYIPPHC